MISAKRRYCRCVFGVMEARGIAEYSEYALFGRHSSAPRTNGIGLVLRVARQLLEIELEPRHGVVDEGAHLRHRETPLWREQVHWQRRIFILVEENLQPPVPDLLGNMIGKQPGDAVSLRGGGHCRANRIDD